MKAKDIPLLHEALVALSPHFLTFYSAFEDGFQQGKGFFEKIPAPCEPHLHADIVRFTVKRWLNESGLEAWCEAEDLSNNGIQLALNKWFIRIRKSARGAVPSPGRSNRLKDLYQQVLSYDFDKHFLLLLWHATPGGDFKGLSLVYPASANTERFRVDIPHPADAAHEKSIYTYQTSFDESGNVEDLGDLEIEPLNGEEDNSEAESQ